MGNFGIQLRSSNTIVHHSVHAFRNRLQRRKLDLHFLIIKDARFIRLKKWNYLIRQVRISFSDKFCVVIAGILFLQAARAQEPISISLVDAIEKGIKSYPALKAKQNYVDAAHALIRNTRNEYLPNVITSLQQSYGTVNTQFGPQAAVGVLGVASSGPIANQQNWNAAFGSSYIISTNWEVFTFGRLKSRVCLSDAQAQRDLADLDQERFLHQVRIAGSYLNLLIARQLVESGRSNLKRSETIQQTVRARTLSGLNPGVDSSLANAEVSRSRLSLIEFSTNEQTIERQLAELLGIHPDEKVSPEDTSFFSKLPEQLYMDTEVDENPQIKFYQSRIAFANAVTKMTGKSILPGITLFGIYQARASGFNNTYNSESGNGYSGRYLDGINPSRYNYVAGVSLTWNLISPLKVRQQVKAQQFLAAGAENEYEQLSRQLEHQLILSEQRIKNTVESAMEVPVQYKAAADAYLQKSVLYKNGLTTIVDLQQALDALNRAEIDKRVAYINVWQALLFKAAASGDFDLFIDQTY